MEEKNTQQNQKNNKNEINHKNRLKFWNNEILINIVKLAGHYFDLVTDFLFIYEKYLDIKEKQINNPTNFGLMNTLIILCIHFSIERYKVFKYLCSIQGEIVESEEQLEEKSIFQSQIGEKSDFNHTFVRNSWKEIIKAFLMSITFTEQFYVKFNYNLKYRKIYSTELSFYTMYFRNALSNLSAFDLIHFQYVTGKHVSYTVIFSALSSLISTAYINYQMYLIRILQNQYYENKKSTPFQFLKLKTQEFICDSLDVQQLKSFHSNGTHFPDLLKIDYLKQKKLQGNKFNIQNQYYEEKINVSFIKKIYILLVCVCHVVGVAIIQVQVDYTMFYVPANLRKSITTLLIMPQFIVYVIVRLKKTQKTKIQKIGYFVLDLIKIPFIHLFAWVQLISPIRNEKIAFVKEVKETWLTNYFPSDYTLIIRQIVYSFWVYHLYQLFENQKGHQEEFYLDYPNYRKVEDITQNSSPLKIIYNIGLYLFFFNSLQFVLYYYEKMVHKKLKQVQIEQILKKKNKYQKIINNLQIQTLGISQKSKQIQSLKQQTLACSSTQNLKMSIFGQIQTSAQQNNNNTPTKRNSSLISVGQSTHQQNSKSTNQGKVSYNNVNLLACSKKYSKKLGDKENNYQIQSCSNNNNEEDSKDKLESQKIPNQNLKEYYEDDILQEFQEQVSARKTEFQSPRKLLSDVYNANDIESGINKDFLDENQGKDCEKNFNYKILSRQISKKSKNSNTLQQ